MHTAIGVFPPYDGTQAVTDYQTWINRGIGCVSINGDWSGTWNTAITSLQYQSGQMAPLNVPVCFGIPGIVTTSSTISAALAGSYDAHYRNMARKCRDAFGVTGSGDGVKSLIFSPNWEGNGSWMLWSATKPGMGATNFVNLYRRMVDAIRSECPDAKFSWRVTLGPKNTPSVNLYPGDAYVDFIDCDVYDEWWNVGNDTDVVQRWTQEYLGNGTTDFRLEHAAAFAAAHGKKLAFSEWGARPTNHVAGNHGGGDNPYFIEAFLDWVTTHDVAWANYFERGNATSPVHRLSASNTVMPNARDAFLGLIRI